MVSFLRQISLLLCLASFTTARKISLLNGRFETTSDVQEYLNLAIDAAEMKETGDKKTKMTIYRNGIKRANENNIDVSLASLSLRAATDQLENPFFHIFRHAFLVLGNEEEGETEGRFDGSAIEQYGDTLINDLWALDVENIETEAAIVLNVWMAVINELFQVTIQCKAKAPVLALEALDRAAAMWIGEGQQDGVNDSGHLLYHLTENAGERFDQDNGETLVNTEIIGLFNEIQDDLQAGKCNTLTGYLNVRGRVKRQTSLMTIPLLQNLIHHTMNVGNEQKSNFVELYALATIPRVAACNPSAYDDELHLDVLRKMTANYTEQALSSIENAYYCFDITCKDIGTYRGGERQQCTDPTGITIAGYSSDRIDVKYKAYLDRDIKAIDIFMKFKAYGLAADWYSYGWSSVYNLQGLAQNKVIPKTTNPNMYDLFANYYKVQSFADTFIMEVLEQNKEPYKSASSEQARHLVTDYLKYVVIVFSAADSFQYAYERCSKNDMDTALDYWDSGAMFLLGSMEGELPSGSPIGGIFLFSTAKELCEEFHTCVAYSDNDIPTAASNEAMLRALFEGSAFVGAGQCDKVKLSLDSILGAMQVPLIQGTLKYASYVSKLDQDSTDGSLGIAHSFSRGLLPSVKEASPNSAAVIDKALKFQLTEKPGSFIDVADAIQDALPLMTIRCGDIGVFIDEENDADLCDDGVWGPTPATLPPSPTSPTAADSIAWGRYSFSDMEVAEGAGSFAEDIRDIFGANTIEAATTIYQQGMSANTIGLDGTKRIVSLQSLSTDASMFMGKDPMFNVYKYALYEDDELEENSSTVFSYADEVIMAAFTEGNDTELAAEGAVILNVWMFIVHRLYESVRLCKEQKDPLSLLDSAVALWIGKHQKQGKFMQGWMLYSIAQSSAKYFGHSEDEEALINTQLMGMFNNAQKLADDCELYPTAYVALRAQVLNIIRRLAVPLVTSLLFHMVENSKNMVELYAVAVVPQMYQCDHDVAAKMEDLLYEGYDFNDVTDEVLSDLTTYLRCERISCEDLRMTANVESAKLKGLVDSLCDMLNYWDRQGLENPIAGYQPSKDVSEIARLDLDLLEIEMMVAVGAFETALEVYEYGHNSFLKGGADSFMSFQYLALYELQDSPTYQLYADYYEKDDYANQFMMDVLQRQNDFEGATWDQCSELASRGLQTIVTYMAVQSRMKEAENYCKQGKIGLSELRWNEAAALFIGSAEGIVAATKVESGRFTYNLGNEVCDEWDSCEESGEATVNQRLLSSFASVRDAMGQGECDHIGRVMNYEILPRMPISVIQGLLSFSNDLSQLTQEDEVSYKIAAAHVFAKSLIPIVEEYNEASAWMIEDLLGYFTSIQVGFSAGQIFDAISEVVRSLKIDCSEIGFITGYEDWIPCGGEGGGIDSDGDGDVGGDGDKDEDSTPLPDTSTNLGKDLYVTSTFVKDKANIGIDVREMKKSLVDNQKEMAKLIYSNGQNSEIFDGNGKFVALRSLGGFSKESTKNMVDEPIFNLYMYSLEDSDGKFMQKDAREYANTYVDYTFEAMDMSHKTLPAEAAVALNLWMETVYLLYKSVSLCEQKKLRDEEGIQSMDVAVAYWIGDGEAGNDGEKGNVMYGLAEEMGNRFNIIEGGQSRTNRNILRLFNEAKNELSLPNACTASPTTHVKLRRTAQKLVRIMMVPLIQALIDNLRQGDTERVKLYGHAIVPMIAGCNSTSYSYLKDKLLNGSFKASETETVIDHVRYVYPCLGLRCDDIGVHNSERTEDAPRCNDVDPLQSLAGYRPGSDVQELSRIDLDIREIEILMTMKAYQAAEDLYAYGKHVEGSGGGSLSLSEIASTSERGIVPQYDTFDRYYDSNVFAEKMIRDALRGDGIWDEFQRKAIVLKGLQSIVMSFGALQAAYGAVSDCKSSGSKSDSWDKAAAMLIGSLEGTALHGGGAEGYLFYSMAQEYCEDFGTCQRGQGSSDINVSEVNQELNNLLYAGRGEILSNNCGSLQKTTNELAQLLQIPSIQGALISSIRLSDKQGVLGLGSLGPNANPVYRAEGYAYSRSLLPLVADVDRSAAETIDKNLGDRAPASPKHIASDVFSSFAKVYPGMNVDCEMIGQTNDFNPCDGVVYKSLSSGLSSAVVSIVVVVVISIALAAGYFFWRRRQRKRLPENNPRFIASEGEFNNHSMNMLEKAFANLHSSDIYAADEEKHRFTKEYDVKETDGIYQNDDDFDEAVGLTSEEAMPDII